MDLYPAQDTPMALTNGPANGSSFLAVGSDCLAPAADAMPVEAGKPRKYNSRNA
jgi:hypothetical protein